MKHLSKNPVQITYLEQLDLIFEQQTDDIADSANLVAALTKARDWIDMLMFDQNSEDEWMRNKNAAMNDWIYNKPGYGEKPKFGIHDIVWYMDGNKPKFATVTSIETSITEVNDKSGIRKRQNNFYRIGSYTTLRPEEIFFPTQDDLLKSIMVKEQEEEPDED